jgi:hypothetical protein
MTTLKIHIRPSGLTDGKPMDIDITLPESSTIGLLREAVAERVPLPHELIHVFAGGKEAGSHMPLDDKLTISQGIKLTSEQDRHHFLVAVDETGGPALEGSGSSDVYRESGRALRG